MEIVKVDFWPHHKTTKQFRLTLTPHAKKKREENSDLIYSK